MMSYSFDISYFDLTREKPFCFPQFYRI